MTDQKNDSLISTNSLSEGPATPDEPLREGNARQHQQWIRERREARRLALQALFEIDLATHAPGDAVDGRLAEVSQSDYGDFAQGAHFLRWLVNGVVKHRLALDEMIQKYAPEWPVDQLAVIDRNILRLAIYEMGSHESDTPPKVIINEAVELGKTFGGDSSPRFVNGVLGSALNEATRKPF